MTKAERKEDEQGFPSIMSELKTGRDGLTTTHVRFDVNDCWCLAKETERQTVERGGEK